jgi:hypothetical protein
MVDYWVFVFYGALGKRVENVADFADLERRI